MATHRHRARRRHALTLAPPAPRTRLGWASCRSTATRCHSFIPIDTPRLVFSGLKRTAHVDEIALKVAQSRGRIALTLRAERHREAFARVFGAGGLEAIERRPLLDELMASANPNAILMQLDALLCCGMAELEPTSPSPTHSSSSPSRSEDPIALARIAEHPLQTSSSRSPTSVDVARAVPAGSSTT